MQIINEELLKKDLTAKKLSKVYVLFGNDTFLPKFYCDKLSDIAYDGDPFFNKQVFNADCDLQDVYDAVKQYPMMSDKKCVVLNNFDFLSCDKSDFDRLLSLISEVEDGCVLILYFSSVLFDTKKDNKVKKILSQVEKIGGKAVCLDHRTTASLIKMLVSGAKKRGTVLSDKNARFIIEKCGDDISVLKNELDKLCAYKQNGEVTKDDIDLICIGSIEANVYDYVAMIATGNVSGALKILDNMFYLRIEPMIILYSVSSVFVDMYRVYIALKTNISKTDIASDFGYKGRAFVLDKSQNYLKKYDFNKLNNSFGCILNTDKELKSFGGNEKQKLEEMTVRLAVILKGGN